MKERRRRRVVSSKFWSSILHGPSLGLVRFRWCSLLPPSLGGAAFQPLLWVVVAFSPLSLGGAVFSHSYPCWKGCYPLPPSNWWGCFPSRPWWLVLPSVPFCGWCCRSSLLWRCFLLVWCWPYPFATSRGGYLLTNTSVEWCWPYNFATSRGGSMQTTTFSEVCYRIPFSSCAFLHPFLTKKKEQEFDMEVKNKTATKAQHVRGPEESPEMANTTSGRGQGPRTAPERRASSTSHRKKRGDGTIKSG